MTEDHKPGQIAAEQAPQKSTVQSWTQQPPSRLTTSQIRSILTSDRIPAEQLVKRVAVCLAAYYDPDTDPEIRAGVRKMYAKALGDMPGFAVLKAFAEWERSGGRRPTPADLRTLAERAVEPFGKELARREAAEALANREAEDRARQRVSPEAAARIMAEAGMTPDRLMAIRRFPMAGSTEEAETKMAEITQPGKHWSEDAAEDDPKWQELRRAREASRPR